MSPGKRISYRTCEFHIRIVECISLGCMHDILQPKFCVTTSLNFLQFHPTASIRSCWKNSNVLPVFQPERLKQFLQKHALSWFHLYEVGIFILPCANNRKHSAVINWPCARAQNFTKFGQCIVHHSHSMLRLNVPNLELSHFQLP